MQIRTERLLLRPIRVSDLDTTCAYSLDPEATRLMMLLPFDDAAETLRALQALEAEWHSPAPERLEFAIEREGAHIGSITYYFQGPPDEVELGWVLHRDHWRQGYATEAALALIDHAREMGLRRVFACCDSENIASYKTMEKLGMRHIATVPGRRNRGMEGNRTEEVYELRLN